MHVHIAASERYIPPKRQMRHAYIIVVLQLKIATSRLR